MNISGIVVTTASGRIVVVRERASVAEEMEGAGATAWRATRRKRG